MTMSQAAPVSPRALWAGRVLSAVIVLFMIFDGVIKLPPLEIVTQTMVQLGWPADANVSRMLGIIGLVSTVLYALPRTSMLGAILLTAYLGGAVATQVRAYRQPFVLAHTVRRLSRRHPLGRPVSARSKGARADPVQPIAATSKPFDGGHAARAGAVRSRSSSLDQIAWLRVRGCSGEDGTLLERNDNEKGDDLDGATGAARCLLPY